MYKYEFDFSGMTVGELFMMNSLVDNLMRELPNRDPLDTIAFSDAVKLARHIIALDALLTFSARFADFIVHDVAVGDIQLLTEEFVLQFGEFVR